MKQFLTALSTTLAHLLWPLPRDARRLLESNPWLLNTPGGRSVWDR